MAKPHARPSPPHARERGLTHLTQCPGVEIPSISKARLIEPLDHRASEEEDANEKKEPERESALPGIARRRGSRKIIGLSRESAALRPTEWRGELT